MRQTVFLVKFLDGTSSVNFPAVSDKPYCYNLSTARGHDMFALAIGPKGLVLSVLW